MDRIISLLAALVGLIALGGAILVHVNGDVQRQELAAEIAQIKGSMTSEPAVAAAVNAIPSVSASKISAPSPSVSEASSVRTSASLDQQTAEISRLEARIAELEQQNSVQASQLAEAQARLGNASSTEATDPNATSVDAAPSGLSGSEASLPPPSIVSAPAPLVPSSATSAVATASAEGPAADCIPGGTRFVGKPGDSFAICKTTIVVKIAAVADGVATVAGVGPIAAGSFGDIPGKGCSVQVFTADASGFADLRVSCQ